jgi:hypothetical protein
MKTEHQCAECGHDCESAVRNDDAKFCPRCGTALAAVQSQPVKEKAATAPEPCQCPECKLDCAKVSPTNGRVDCPRCGTFVKSISMNSFLYGGECSTKKTKQNSIFRMRTAKRATVWSLIPAVIMALAGNFEGMAGMVVVATPIFFVVGGLIGGVLNQGAE